MDRKDVKICWLVSDERQDLNLPKYETSGAAGMDVEAALQGSVTLQPGEIKLIPTGFAVELPRAYELQVRPRSGLAVKHGVTIINSPGTIDSDYRGEVKVGLINLGKEPYSIMRGDRIAQLVLAPVSCAVFTVVDELGKSDRDIGGFGHTGV